MKSTRHGQGETNFKNHGKHRSRMARCSMCDRPLKSRSQLQSVCDPCCVEHDWHPYFKMGAIKKPAFSF